MCEFSSLDRCAAYVAARAAMATIQRVAAAWPESLAERARRDAITTVQRIAEAVSHDHASPRRRHCLREALRDALAVAAAVDAARAMGKSDDDLLDAQRAAGRSVTLLGLFLHANTAAICATPELDGLPPPAPSPAVAAATVAARRRSPPPAPPSSRADPRTPPAKPGTRPDRRPLASRRTDPLAPPDLIGGSSFTDEQTTI
jgi:hypothetical protein